MRFQRLLILVVVLVLPCAAWAQRKPTEPGKPAETEKPADPTLLVIDMADGTEQTLDVDAGTYKVGLANAVPGRKYFLRIGPSQPVELPVLTMPGAATKTESTARDAEGCSKLVAETLALLTVTEEAGVAKKVDAVRVALASAGECEEDRKDALKAIGLTTPDFPTAVTLTAEAVRDLTISSGLAPNWKIHLNSAGRGVWQTSFGFVFNPNHDEDFFSEATGDEEFTIRRKTRDKNSITFLPSVFFNWLSSDQAFSDFQQGPTLGIGLTTDGGRIGGMLGWSIRFNQNIGLTAGVSVYPHRRLDAKYHEGQVLKESLDSDQLNKDSVRGNIFVAFTLRLASSPFGK